MTRPISLLVLAAVGAGVLGATSRPNGARTEEPATRGASARRATDARTRAPNDLDGPRRDAGPTAPQQAAPTVSSPASAQVALGERLFVSYNCGDCHGAAGAGAMAPSLQDNRWHFGGSPDDVFRSIAEGRPGGMPTWGKVIPGPEMVALAAYVRSLGDGKDLTTENFTGATVERSGH